MSNHEFGINLGLDFGTSNSSVGSYNEGNLKIVEDKSGELSQPSSIFVRADGYRSTGKKAITDFLDPSIHSDTYHFIPSAKPGLPIEQYDGIVLHSRHMLPGRKYPSTFFSIEELASILISDLKQKAEIKFGCQAEKVVIGRPVVFSNNEKMDNLARERLERAARISGFREVCFMPEPVAAALYFERFYLEEGVPKKLFVFDFGGGTLDTCVLRAGENSSAFPSKNLSEKVIASHGIDLGGTDLDKDIFRECFFSYFGREVTYNPQGLRIPHHIFDDISEWHLMQPERERQIFDTLRMIISDADCSDRNAVLRLMALVKDQGVFAFLQGIELAKIGVNVNGHSQIVYKNGTVDIHYSLTAKEYDRSIAVRLSQIEDCIRECLNRAQIRTDEVDIVLKTGGSSNNRFVHQLLTKIFEDGKIKSSDMFTSVVAGLSIAAADIFSQ